VARTDDLLVSATDRHINPIGSAERSGEPVAQTELDPRLDCLMFLADGVYAIAMTLLAIDLFLPEATSQLRSDELLTSLVDRWPEVLAFVTSFTFIANFWVGHTMQFHLVRRFDGGPDVARSVADDVRRLHALPNLRG